MAQTWLAISLDVEEPEFAIMMKSMEEGSI
jgi:hypothetical protein